MIDQQAIRIKALKEAAQIVVVQARTADGESFRALEDALGAIMAKISEVESGELCPC